MDNDSSNTVQDLLNKRDAKAVTHLKEYAPVWLVDEKINQFDEMVRFNVIFHHPIYGWVDRSYRYDGFSNILYYLGQATITNNTILSLQEHRMYINPEDEIQASSALSRTATQEMLIGSDIESR